MDATILVYYVYVYVFDRFNLSFSEETVRTFKEEKHHFDYDKSFVIRLYIYIYTHYTYTLIFRR